MARFLEFEGVDAVLFDCDGVLVDSEPISEWAWREALAGFGVDLGPFDGWVGTTDEAIAREYSDAAGTTAGELLSRAGDLLRSRLREGLEVFADAAEAVVNAHRADLATAVVSNSERWRLEALLTAAGLEDRFDVSVSSDDVSLPKPAPDMYLLAARLLGVPVSRCLVLEDSPLGVSAARAAGMRVVAVDRGMFSATELAAATRLVTSLADSARF